MAGEGVGGALLHTFGQKKKVTAEEEEPGCVGAGETMEALIRGFLGGGGVRRLEHRG